MRNAYVVTYCRFCHGLHGGLTAEVIDAGSITDTGNLGDTKSKHIKVEFICGKCGMVIDTSWFERIDYDPTDTGCDERLCP